MSLVDGVAWVGIRADDVERLAQFFEMLGLDRVHEATDFVVLDAPNGDRIEVFGPAGPQPDHQFAANQVMVGLAVPDLASAVERLRDAGVELLGDGGPTWQHFRGPDGLVYELTERR
jgi:catechol 2,3-dioxygenase-like lactoylglutathione lyase family enzyme